MYELSNDIMSGQGYQHDTIASDMNDITTKYKLLKKAGGRIALSLYVFLPTACFYFELLELVHVDLF